MRIKVASVFLSIIAVFSLHTAKAQDKKGSVKLSTDLVSSYIWRGCPGYSPLQGQNILAPAIQPTLAYTYSGFEAGAWGSVDFTGTYKEVDLYALYSLKNFTLTFTDYYWDLDWLNNNYFDYRKDSTSHIFELSLGYKNENFPLSILVASFIGGADKKAEDPTKNNYSTYIELGYSLPVNDQKIDFALGMTPDDGFYGDGYGGRKGFSIVNVSATGYRNIKISNDYTLPVKASLIANPQHEKLYLVVGITL
ncbi:MAG: hypothetical protein NTU44_14120 [Bacteroidetes bacterium]|nr:hypothetical protein [Bacteroidota bacterium]